MNLRNFWKKIKKPFMTVAAVILVLLLFVVSVTQNQAAPENPMEKENADPSRMYVTSSSLAMDESLLDSVENANINTGNQENQEEQEEEQQEEQDEENQDEEQQEEQQQEENQEENSDNSTETQEQQTSEEQQQVSQTPLDSNSEQLDSLLPIVKKDKTKNNSGTGPSGGDSQNGGNGNSGNSGQGTGGNGNGTGEGEGDSQKDGKQIVVAPENSEAYFTTSLKNEVVTEAEYPFSITYHSKLSVISTIVDINGNQQNYNGSITLSEGENKVTVYVTFRDKWSNIRVSSPTYTIYYNPSNQILIIADELKALDGQTVQEQQLDFTAYALKGTERVKLVIRRNNEKALKPTDGDTAYTETLSEGKNVFTLIAGTGTATVSESYTIYYDSQKQADDFTLTLEGEKNSSTITLQMSGGYQTFRYENNTNSFRFRFNHSQITGKEEITSVVCGDSRGGTYSPSANSNGWYTISLYADRETPIAVGFTDSNGNSGSYTWNIEFNRTGETPSNMAPVVEHNLKSEYNTEYVDLNVSAKEVSGGGGTLSADNMHIYVNGEEVGYRGRSGTAYEYLLHLQQGENEVVISVKDNQQYETTKTYTVLYNPSQITVTFQLEAGTVGLGMLIPRHEVTIDGNTTLAQLVEQQLAEYNFTSMITGSVDNSYYLAGIKKPGMTNGLHVPDELKQMIIEDGMGWTGSYQTDALWEKDFAQWSGWMVCVNNYYVGTGMASRNLSDGDEIRVRYTLAGGKDIGQYGNEGVYGNVQGNYGKEW